MRSVLLSFCIFVLATLSLLPTINPHWALPSDFSIYLPAGLILFAMMLQIDALSVIPLRAECNRLRGALDAAKEALEAKNKAESAQQQASEEDLRIEADRMRRRIRSLEESMKQTVQNAKHETSVLRDALAEEKARSPS